MPSQFRHAVNVQDLQIFSFDIVDYKFTKQYSYSGLLSHRGFDCVRRKAPQYNIDFHTAGFELPEQLLGSAAALSND